MLINNCRSDPKLISCGVPQGSVLGPVLFVLYTAPLSDVFASHFVIDHSFADDTQLQKSSEPHQLDNAIQSMETCISDVKSWMTHNKLRLNDDKTEALVVCSQRMSASLSLPESLSVGNASVPFSKSAKNLGVTIDSNHTMQT